MITAVPQTDESPRGYVRDDALQEAFDGAATRLLELDGWDDPAGTRVLRADLALEGGGVKGIGLVGAVLALSEAGYSFRGVAGTSAGAIAACLIAGISAQPEPKMTDLLTFMNSMDFSKFMPEGKLHGFLERVAGHVGDDLADVGTLTHKMGIYPGDYLRTWLAPILHDTLGIKTFADLRLPRDPGQSLPEGHDYRLVVHTSDITRGQLVQLPWDYPLYTPASPDTQDPVDAVRATMSITFFFEPVTFTGAPTTTTIPNPSGGTTTMEFKGGTVTWVDGGMLQNFPIHAFDRLDDAPARWPTIGIKLSSLQTSFEATTACTTALEVGVRCLRTMMNEWDTYAVDEQTAARTIFVDNARLTATDFDLTAAQQKTLFVNGVQAATDFVIAMAAADGVPRSSDQGKVLITQRRQRAGAGSPGPQAG